MKFYIPGAPNAAMSEQIYEGICKYIRVTPIPAPNNRIWGVRWRHQDHEHMAKVDRKLDGFPDADTVIAIIDAGASYAICTRNNGVLTGEPLWAPRTHVIQVWHFEPPDR